MGIGPIPAVRRLLERTGVAIADIDLVELNEAFASQSVAVVRELGLDPDRVNVNGGAIALGHPLGMSGARLVVSLRARAAPPRRPLRARDAVRRRRSGPGRALRGAAGMTSVRTQVGIVGAGPAGLTLAQLLRSRGIESVVLESRSRDHCEKRIRAGVLEQGSVDLLSAIGAGERLQREGIVHHGVELQFDGERHRIPLSELTGGAAIVIYGQTEVVKDLIAIRLGQGDPLLFCVGDVALHDLDERDTPDHLPPRRAASTRSSATSIAGCDGFHGVSRPSIPAGVLRATERDYPFGWLGILADVAPSSEELVYAHHERGFALLSLRSPDAQPALRAGAPRRGHRRVARRAHLGGAADAPRDVRAGRSPRGRSSRRASRACAASSSSRCSTAACSWPATPPTSCPPTGAKGLNLAIADVELLGEAIAEWYAPAIARGLDGYSAACLRRVWRAEHFSWWMTSMLHRLPGDDPFDRELQLAQLRYVVSSPAAATTLAENYVGLAGRMLR